MLSRRSFLQTLAATGSAAALDGPLSAAEIAPLKIQIKLGMDNFAVRAMGWKAPPLLDYAAALKLDALLISDLDAFDSLTNADLREIAKKARGLGIDLFVGCNLDSGNAAWTLEDPLEVLATLGPLTICSSLRDDMIWETPDGASVQWTTCGEGLIDWKKYAARWAELCPAVPLMIETISGFAKNFAYKKDDFWQHYDKRPERLAAFEALAKRGQVLPPFKPADGADRKLAEQDYQKGELERSIKYLREQIGLGTKG
ncbi:MAG: twin-arginine translocation signal domain-containing protein [Verrucomicrobia bacterium]|nr:MAG: twin-arginine translocation signal domain-containing protein [Verrucomicrobiota bacterium]